MVKEVWPQGDAMRRRHFLRFAATATALPVAARIVRAQNYPTRPVRWLVGFTAGGLNDVLARLIGQALSERLGQQFVIENRVGAGGNIATEQVVNAPPVIPAERSESREPTCNALMLGELGP